VLPSLREFGPPAADTFERIPYSQAQTMTDFRWPARCLTYWKSARSRFRIGREVPECHDVHEHLTPVDVQVGQAAVAATFFAAWSAMTSSKRPFMLLGLDPAGPE
jgi:hypothetical protein